MDQNYYYSPTVPDGGYARPLSVKNYYNRRHSSYGEMADPRISPSSPYYHEPSYFSKSRDRRRQKQKYTRNSYQEYSVTPEDERNNSGFPYYNNHSRGDTTTPEAEEDATYDNHYDTDIINGIPLQNQDMDDDEGSFIEDTTTQRNTLINAEPTMAIDQNVPPLYDHQQQQKPPTPPSEQKKSTPVPTIEKKNGKDTAKQAILPLQRTSSPTIQVISITNGELLGDVLDSQQQKEILSQLSSPQPSSNHSLSPEKTKITSLDRIWVFRLIEEGFVRENVAWIGFDFENQLKIEQHLKDLESRPEDGRLALYDSHIRHKTMPVIVTPNENKGYYFADVHQNDLITLEVTCIENHHQKVTFVYRV